MADLEQQHPPVMPSGNTHEPYANQGAAHGDATSSPIGWLKTPRGILRLVEFLFAIISFGAMSDASMYDHESSFKFLVAVGVMIFIYTIVLIVTYIFEPKVTALCVYQPVIELGLDGIFCVLLLAAGAAAAAKCNEKNSDTGYSICNLPDDFYGKHNKDNIKASIVFTFFNLICFAASTFFSWRVNANEEAKR
jgi:hypothetical protein